MADEFEVKYVDEEIGDGGEEILVEEVSNARGKKRGFEPGDAGRCSTQSSSSTKKSKKSVTEKSKKRKKTFYSESDGRIRAFFFFSSSSCMHFFSGTKHPREDNPNLYCWAEITGLHTNI